MNGELKSKFRDRVKYFRKMLFLKKKKGSNINLEDEKKIDFSNIGIKPSVKKIYVRKKRKLGIEHSLSDLNLKKNIYNNSYNKNENLNKKNDNKNKIVKMKFIKKRNNVPVINNVFEFGVNDPLNSKLNSNSISNKKYNEIKKKDFFNNANLYNKFDEFKHSEKNDREFMLNTIIGKLNNKSKKMLYELDNLYSEYYHILNFSEEEKEIEDCEKKIREIKSIKKQINIICEQFNIINDDKYLEDVLELDDSNLIDDIILYKNLCKGLLEKKEVYDNYKKIKDYDKLTVYFDKFNKKIDDLKIIKEKKKEEIENRDKDFVIFKKNVNLLDVKNENYISIINSQVDVSNYLLKNVENIFKSESVSFKLRGFSDFISSSFKYLFFLSVFPFRGLFPSIAINTIAARNMVRNFRKGLELEEIRKINYYADDYENQINKYIYDINNLNNLLFTTLDDIKDLKVQFNKKYGIFSSKINEYKEIYNKIEKVEKMVNFNISRVKKIEKSLKLSEVKNKDKLMKVKILNNKNND